MIASNISTIIKKYEGFGGNFVDSQYMAAAYDSGKPHMLETMMTQVFASKNRLFDAKNLFDITYKQSGGIKEITTDIYRYKMMGDPYRFARVVENLEVGNLTPGINLTPFKVKLDLDYYAYPDVLMGEDPETPVQVIDTIPEGTGTIYTLKLQGDRPDIFFDPSSLGQGKLFNKVWTSVQSEANHVFGTQQTGSVFMLENQVSAFAQSLTVTDKAMREDGRLGVTFRDEKSGKEVNMFLPYYEAKMHDELHRNINAQLIYGVKGTQQSVHSKYHTRTGPGTRAQLRDSWQEYYNGPLPVSLVKDFLLDISVTRNSESERMFTGLTGTIGANIWHDALVAISNGFLTVDTNFVKPTSSAYTKSALQFGAQFTRYIGPVGLDVQLAIEPCYDSQYYCKRMHPLYPSLPIDSARITFLNLAPSEGENNVIMLKVKDTYRYGHKLGTVGPNGPIQGGMFGDLIAAYTVAVEATAGILIKDPTICGELIYDYAY